MAVRAAGHGSGRGARYPSPPPELRFGLGGPGDVAAVVRARHRAEAAEWLALYSVFVEESSRLLRLEADLGRPTHEYERVEAAEATCARWCLSAPVTVGTARHRLRAAIQLFEYLPETARGFLDGLVSAQLVQRIVARTYEVTPEACPALDAGICSQIVDAIAAGQRFSAVALDSAVDALARRLHTQKPVDDAGTRLTLDRCRSVALLLLVAGSDILPAAGIGAEAESVVAEEWREHSAVQRHASASSGGSDPGSGVSVVVHATEEAVASPSPSRPAWISRIGLVPSSSLTPLLTTARRVTPRAGPAGQIHPVDPLSWLTTPRTPPDPRAWETVREMLPDHALRYAIPVWLKEKIRLRDGTCRFPGCGVPASDCDVDHLRPFLHRDPIAGGWTIEANLGCLCRTHHRLKTHDRWTVTTDEHAGFTFTSPDGTVAHTYPAGPAALMCLEEAMLGGHAREPSEREPSRGLCRHGCCGDEREERDPVELERSEREPSVAMLTEWARADLASADALRWSEGSPFEPTAEWGAWDEGDGWDEQEWGPRGGHAPPGWTDAA